MVDGYESLDYVERLKSLDQKIDLLTKIVSMYDLNIKIVLDRTNKIHAYIEQIQKEYAAEQQAVPPQTLPLQQPVLDNKPIPVISAEYAIAEANNVDVSQRRGVRVDASPEAVVEQSSKKVPVVQRVTDNIGKDLFMADVSIFDENKKLVHKTKTTATGKWQAYLKSGVYNISIIKTDTASSSKLEALQKISVPESSGVFTLPTAVITRK